MWQARSQRPLWLSRLAWLPTVHLPAAAGLRGVRLGPVPEDGRAHARRHRSRAPTARRLPAGKDGAVDADHRAQRRRRSRPRRARRWMAPLPPGVSPTVGMVPVLRRVGSDARRRRARPRSRARRCRLAVARLGRDPRTVVRRMSPLAAHHAGRVEARRQAVDPRIGRKLPREVPREREPSDRFHSRTDVSRVGGDLQHALGVLVKGVLAIFRAKMQAL